MQHEVVMWEACASPLLGQQLERHARDCRPLEEVHRVCKRPETQSLHAEQNTSQYKPCCEVGMRAHAQIAGTVVM